MGFTRSDLLHTDYDWRYLSPAPATGISESMLDRGNGYDMLRCISWCAMKLGYADQLPTCQILEIDIRYVVPAGVCRYRDILAWLLSRYLFLLY